MKDGRRPLVEAVRRACIEAAVDGYEQASTAGLCREGAFEAALSAIRRADLDALAAREEDAETEREAPERTAAAPPRADSDRLDARDGVLRCIGGTPLLRLRRLSEQTGCNILAKAEFTNPGGSVKDRTALFLVRDAEARGRLRPGGTIVEGTAGNTGIGLALVGNALGYRTRIVIPATQSREKKDLLRLYGAELHEVPAAPYRDPAHYVHTAERLAKELEATEPAGVFYANQWDNLANREAHFRTTGPEIWHQTGGRVDGFACAIGTGGTLSGVGLYLKRQRPDVVVAVADPHGSAMYRYFTDGRLESEGSSLSEGIGQGRVTANVEGAPVDDAFRIPDDEMLEVLFDLIAHEGLCLGGSSGVNVAGAVRLARKLGPGHTIVTLLPDAGARYQSRLYDPAVLRERGLPVPAWLARPHPPR